MVFPRDGREPGSEIRIELGIGVERALGEHDEVVVAVQLVGEREVFAGEQLILLRGEGHLLVVALEHGDA